MCIDSQNPFLYSAHAAAKSAVGIAPPAHIDLHAPDGSHLESIGHRIKEIDAENNTYRLHEQIILVESLLGNMHQPITLPREAVSALADMLYRMQGITGKIVK